MRRIPALAAFAAFAMSLFAAVAARAGDTAFVEVLGFTADGSVFAFEEYGIQDGSGFPYANRYYIDTAADRFVPGTPVRVRLDDESASLDAAREEARQRGESVVPQAELTANQGYVAGWNAATELSADPWRMRVNPRPIFPPLDAPLEFLLEEVDVPQRDSCALFDRIVGFRLNRVGIEAGEPTVTIHEDVQVPESRGCPLGYRIGGIVTFHPQAQGAHPVYAVMVTVRRGGFEGPDHRWIALTGRLD